MYISFSNGTLGRFWGRYWGIFSGPKNAIELAPRRSVSPKDYVTGGSVPARDLHRMLEAANWAPTHGKTQPWHYVILSGPRAIQRYLDFVSEWYTARADTIAEEKLSRGRIILPFVNMFAQRTVRSWKK